MTEHPRRGRTSLVLNAVLFTVAFGLLGWVLWKNQGPIREVLRRGVDPWVFALGFAICLTSLILTFIRWFFLVRALGLPFTVHDAIRLGFIGNLYNLVIPGAVGGDLIKATYLIREQAKKTQAIASMLIDRILGLLGLFMLAGIAGIRAWPVADAEVKRLIAVVWFAVVVGLLGLAAILGQALTRRYPHLLEGPGRLATILVELRALSIAYSNRLGVVGLALAMSMFIHALNVTAFYVVSTTIFPNALPSLGSHFLIVPLVLFTTAVPLPFGAIGLSETVSDRLFLLVAHPGGALAMMGFRVLMYAVGIVSVLVYLANIGQARDLKERAEHLEEDLRDEPPSTENDLGNKAPDAQPA
jgi:uncharacterized protein (TIRG00374 family)